MKVYPEGFAGTFEENVSSCNHLLFLDCFSELYADPRNDWTFMASTLTILRCQRAVALFSIITRHLTGFHSKTIQIQKNTNKINKTV